MKSTQKCGSLTEGGAESDRPNMSRNERQRTSSRARSRRCNPRGALTLVVTTNVDVQHLASVTAKGSHCGAKANT